MGGAAGVEGFVEEVVVDSVGVEADLEVEEEVVEATMKGLQKKSSRWPLICTLAKERQSRS